MSNAGQDNRTGRAIRGLYAVTPDVADTSALMSIVGQALRGGCRLVQYRNKVADASLRCLQVAKLTALCNQHDACLIVNDDATSAAAAASHGVHLGRDDGSVSTARGVLGPSAIIGVSCYNEPERAVTAAREGADYIAFGSFFPSTVKPDAVRASSSLIMPAKQVTGLPVVAIGGITPDNAPQLVNAGVDAIAVISALWNSSDIEGTARQFSALFH